MEISACSECTTFFAFSVEVEHSQFSILSPRLHRLES